MPELSNNYSAGVHEMIFAYAPSQVTEIFRDYYQGCRMASLEQTRVGIDFVEYKGTAVDPFGNVERFTIHYNTAKGAWLA